MEFLFSDTFISHFSEIKNQIIEQVFSNINVILILCYIIGGYVGKSIKLHLFKSLSNRFKTITFFFPALCNDHS